MAIFRRKPPDGASNAGVVGKNRDSEPIFNGVLLTLRLARCCQYDAAGPPFRKLCHLSLVVSGGVDSRRRRRNVYDKKPQRYAKDNRTAHLTTRSDKSVAYLTDNNRLYSLKT